MNPSKLLRMALFLGMVMVTPAPGLAQETGVAVKGGAVDLSQNVSQENAPTGVRSVRPVHKRLQKDPRNLPVDDTRQQAGQPVTRSALASPQSMPMAEPQTLAEPSPAPSLSLLALPDNGEVAPPDTFGAVGPSHLVVACASEIRISDRSGNVISTRSQEVFWTNVARYIFDTRVVYDPYGQRFIMTAAAIDPTLANPRLCIAVTASSNPTGNWYRWSEDVDASSSIYADSPTVGFNKTWIVVQANMYSKSTFAFFRSRVYAYNKANLYANGTGQRTVLTFDQYLGGSQVPATMYDSANPVVYFVQNWNGYVTNSTVCDGPDCGLLRLFSLIGGIGSERLVITNSSGPIFADFGRPWAEGSSNDVDLLPQLGGTNKIYAGDSRIQNVHFRDGLLYATHTVFVPATAPTRAAVQWWVITATADPLVQLVGRVEDESGTNMFAYPSISANRYQDVLLGYSRFSPQEHPSAAYSFRRGNDPTDELRGEVLLKAGATNYSELIAGQHRWGDWSATTVDPVNDVDLWTIQQYAAPHDIGRSRWGTWWGRVSPPVNLGITMSEAPDPVPSGSQATYTLRVTNKQDAIISGVWVQDTLPPGLSYVSATASQGSCGHTNGIVGCSIGTMTELASATVTLTVTAGLPAFVTNMAVVGANGPDFDSLDNTALEATEIINSADLQVTGSDSPDPVHQGNTVTYTLTILNRGPSAAGGVVMTSTLPASVTVGAITASQGFWTNIGNVIAFTLGSINNGASAVITIPCAPAAGGMITNEVRVGANTFDTVLGNNTVNVATRVNFRPIINHVPLHMIDEDVPTLIPITISDVETAAVSLQLLAVSSNQGLIPNANIVRGGSGQNRTLTITSAPNQFGSNTTTITVTVTDSEGASSVQTFPINVRGVNDPPTISNIISPAPIPEDSSANANFTIGDIDTPISALTLSATSGNLGLIPVENIQFSPSGTARTVTVTPAANQFGTSLITVTVSDGSLSASDPFNVTVNPVNDPPVVSGILPQFILEDTATTNIHFTVSDPETAAVNLVVLATSDNQTLVPNGNIVRVNSGTDRTVRVTPAADQHGVVNITVSVSDGTNTVFTAFPVTVSAVNDPPTLTLPSTVTTNEDTGPVTVALTGIGSGAPNESQPLTIQASTSRPDLAQNLQVNYTSPNPSGTLTFSLVPHANGTALIDLVVSDGNVADNLARQLSVTINAVNDSPTIAAIDDLTVPEDSGQRSIPLTGISTGPPNEAGQVNQITAISSAQGIVPHPQIIYNPGDSTGILRFTPVAHATGTVTITVTVNDGQPQNPITTETFQVTVDAINDIPTMAPHLGDRTINEEASTGLIAFNFRDVEAGPLTVEGFSSNQALVPNGNVVITGTGTNRNLNVTPLANEFGTAFITVRVSDAEGGATNQTFLLTVGAINDPPTLASIPTPPPIDEDASQQTVNLSGITPGPSNESTQQVRITATSSNPSIVPHPTVNYTFPNPTGPLTYTPVANATGSVVITVTADDRESANNLATRTFTVQVNSVNDLPAIDGDFEDKFTDEDVPANIPITIGDVETPAGSLTLRGVSSNRDLVADTDITFTGTGASRTVVVRPLADEFGNTFITISVTDGANAVTEVGFGLNVIEVDDPPMIATVPAAVNEDNTLSANFWVNDVDTALPNLTLAGTSSNQGIVPNANIIIPPGSGTNRTIQLTPAPNAHGEVTIFVTVGDGASDRASQFTLTVNSINDPPALDDIPTQEVMEDSGQQWLTLTGVGPGAADETSDVLTVSAVSSLPTLIPHPVATNDNGTWKLRFGPVPNASGSANITVTVNDGRPVNPTTSKSFLINVLPVNDPSVNDPPTILGLVNATTLEDTPVSVPFTIHDDETYPARLTLTASSTNLTLVSNTNIVFHGSDSTRWVTITPTTNLSGLTRITVNVGDGTNNVSASFHVTVTASNDPPTLNNLANVALGENPPNHTVNFSGVGTGASNEGQTLSVRVASSNPALIPAPTSISYTNPNTSGSFILNPANSGTGSSVITVTVWDNGAPSNSFSRSFTVFIRPSANGLPSISGLTSRTAPEDTPITMNFTVGDAITPASSLVVGAFSTNPNLLPTNAFAFGGADANRSVTITPMADHFGTASVTVWVTDAQFGYAASTLTLTVTNVNDPPVISSIPSQTIVQGTSLRPVPFTISDLETPAHRLNLSALSSNQDLLPTANVILGGLGTDRSVMAYPVSGQTGSATITINVTDANAASTNTTFLLTVQVQGPTLTIRLAGQNLELMWPTGAGGYTPQGRDRLDAGDWADIIVTPEIRGAHFVVPRPISGPHKFFRLRN